MKREQEAINQYSELTNALVQMGIGWIVTEVDEVISRGKAVLFRDLSDEQSLLYESRLSEEARWGLTIGRAKANDFIGVPYEPHERLALLVDAVERVVVTSELSKASLSRFASRLGISSVVLESPIETDIAASAPEPRVIPLVGPALVNERLSILHHVLRDEVLE
jgi:hypothetical protein